MNQIPNTPAEAPMLPGSFYLASGGLLAQVCARDPENIELDRAPEALSSDTPGASGY